MVYASNDDCTGAIPVIAGINSFSTLNTISSVNPSCSCDQEMAYDVW